MTYQVGSYAPSGEWHTVAGYDPRELHFARREDAEVALDTIRADTGEGADLEIREIV